MMQGVIENVAPRLAADLERSNPERAWRILLLNLAITAIRTEDEAMMAYAFDRLDQGLPGNAPGSTPRRWPWRSPPGWRQRSGNESRPGTSNGQPPTESAIISGYQPFSARQPLTGARPRAQLKFFFDLFPVILFFVAFKFRASMSRPRSPSPRPSFR